MGRRETFDAERSFVANRSFLWAGQPVGAGQPFTDKSSKRRLRQLYDGRFLRMLPPEEQRPEADDGRPVFAAMTVEELLAWMKEHGVIAHPKLNKDGLVKKARLLWLELKAGVTRPTVPEEAEHGVVVGGHRELRPEGSGEGLQEPVGEGATEARVRLGGGRGRRSGSRVG